MSENQQNNTEEDLWEQSAKEHKELSDKFHVSTTALAFGSLWYLQSLEEHLPLSEAQYPMVLQIAWYCAYLSCVFGGVHLWIDMFRPIRAYNAGNLAKLAYLSGDHDTLTRIVQQATRRTFWVTIPAWCHLLFLVILFVAAGFYKAANFQ